MALNEFLVKACLFLILAILEFERIHGSGSEIQIEGLNCTVNPEFSTNITCILDKSVNPSEGYVTMVLENDLTEILMDVELRLINEKKNKKRTVLNLKNVDACEVISGRGALNKIVDIFKSIIYEFGTFPKGCPIHKGYFFEFKHVHVSADKFPGFLPETGYDLTFKFHTRKALIYCMQFTGHVTRDL